MMKNKWKEFKESFDKSLIQFRLELEIWWLLVIGRLR